MIYMTYTHIYVYIYIYICLYVYAVAEPLSRQRTATGRAGGYDVLYYATL